MQRWIMMIRMCLGVILCESYHVHIIDFRGTQMRPPAFKARKNHCVFRFSVQNKTKPNTMIVNVNFKKVSDIKKFIQFHH